MKHLVTLFLVLFFTISTSLAFANTRAIDVKPSTTSIIQDKTELQKRIENLESQINELEIRVRNAENRSNSIPKEASVGGVSFLFGAFCALWAQNTMRNAVGWFFAGALLTVLATIFVLWYNYNDNNNPPNRAI